ncbi:MAG: M48 family metalloprotease [Micromonosporaceae bacterium]|nr:M48 family metalloprotease [Micromonosporaceae bacterium]
MIPAGLLLAYALLTATLGAWWLRRAAWPQHAPRLGVAVWQALSVSTALSVVLASLVVTIPRGAVGAGFAELLRACVWALRAEYGAVGGPLMGAAGAAVGGGVAARAAYCLIRESAAAVRERRRHAALLAPVARLDTRLRALVVPCEAAAAYCLPGGHGRIVLTTGALDVLDPGQLTGVLAHERAHLRGRHHLAVGVAVALARAFPGVPVFRHAADQIPQLLEMLADDAAVRHGDRGAHAAALVALAARGGAPARALAAGGPEALARVRRLVAPRRPFGPVRRAAALIGVVALIALPIVVAAAPALAAAQTPHCPVEVSVLG